METPSDLRDDHTSAPMTENTGPVATASARAGPNLGTRVFQNTAAQLGGRAFGMACSAGTSVLLARYFGREQFGEFGAIYAYLALFAFLGSFSLEPIIAREISVRRAHAAQILHAAKLSALATGFAGAILAYLIGPLFGYSGQLRWLILLAAVDLLILPSLKFSSIIFQIEMRLWNSVGVNLFRQSFWFLAVFLLTRGHATLSLVVLVRMLCGVLEYFALDWQVRRSGLIQGTQQFLSDEARLLLRDALPLVLGAIGIGVYQRIDQVMLHKMVGDAALAPYVVAVQLTEVLNNLPVALMISLFPALAQSVSDEQRFQHYLKTCYRLLLLVAFAACAVLIPLAEPLIRLLYGPQFSASASLFVVLVWSDVPIFFTVVIGNALIAKRLQNYFPLTAAAGAVCNVLMNLVLIPKYGALGASWATVVSYCLAGILLFLLFPKTRQLVLVGLRLGAPPFLLVAALTIGLHFVLWPVWTKLVVSICWYSVGVLLTRTLLRSDLQRAWALWRGQFA